VSRIYVDGCSFTYGEGLSRKYSLANLISADIDMSLPGKSNNNIIYDTYEHINTADIFVLGFTFANRTTLWDNNRPLGINPSKLELEQLFCHTHAALLEEKYKDFHKIFYTLYNERYQNTLSDFFIDGIIEVLKSKQKKIIVYSMEKRNCINKIFYPNINNRQSDGHYNEIGMELLAKAIKERL
jgi:hypothetical protein